MPSPHDRLTIASIAVITTVTAVMLHEGVGHGLTAYLRGDVPTMLTSNHLSDEVPDRLVSAGGTIVNLVVGAIAFLAHRRARNHTLRYALWLFAAFNLMEGAGYFLFSGVFGFGDWESVIHDLPGYGAIRAGMAVFGLLAYGAVMWRLAVSVRDFAPDDLALWILPYFAAAIVQCAAGALDPEGLKLFLLSTVPATFGGTSGLLWGRKYIATVEGPRERVVGRVPALWVAAAIVAIVHIAIDGPGISLMRGAAS